MPILTLLTDFGLTDTYVAQMKGVILSIAPACTIVDITHGVPPQDVPGGAYLLWTGVGAFPQGSVHLAVVDPGVGSSRRAIAVSTGGGDFLVGPDNGLLMPAALRLGGVASAVALPTPPAASTTFHGRDIFAPAAARLAAGVALNDLGTPISDLVPLTLPAPTEDGGEVIHVDTYGNLVTNIPASALTTDTLVLVGGEEVPILGHYAAAEAGVLLALVGSAGLLEISVRDGSAAERLGAQRGAGVKLSRPRPRE